MRFRILSLLFFSCITIFGQSDDIKPYKILIGHDFKVNVINFSKDDKYLISTSWDNSVRVWAMDSFKCVKVLKGHTENVWGCAINSDNSKIFSTSLDRTLIMWDFKTGRIINRLKVEPYDAISKGIISELDTKFPNSVYSVDIAPNQANIAIGSADNLVRICDANTLNVKNTLDKHTNWILGVKYSPDGKYLISGGFQSEVIIWETETLIPTHIFTDKDGYNGAFVFTSDGKKILVTGKCKINILEIETGEILRSIPVQCQLQSVQLTNDGKYIITCSEDSTVRLYDFKTGIELWMYKNPKPEICDCKLSHDNKYLAVSTPESNILIWRWDEIINNCVSLKLKVPLR